MAGSPKKRAKMALQAAIAAGIVEPPKRSRTRPTVERGDDAGTAGTTGTATDRNTGTRAPVPTRSLPNGLSDEQLDSILTALSCGVTFEAALASATKKRFKDEVKEVVAGQECGMAFEGYQDMRQGDVIECFTSQARSRAGS